MRRIRAGADLRLDPDALVGTIRADRWAGRRPFCVIANAGTSECGVVDDLPVLARICEEESLWLHVDGAYGGAAAIGELGGQVLRGIERADSLVIDAHRWLFRSHPLGCLFVRDSALLDESFHSRAFYYNSVEAPARPLDFKDRDLRRARSLDALELWMTLKTTGVATFRRKIDHCLRIAEAAEDELRKYHGWEVVGPAQLAVLTFRYQPEGVDETTSDELQRRVCAEAIRFESAMITTTVVRGRVVLRMCTIHPDVTEDDIRALVQLMVLHSAEL